MFVDTNDSTMEIATAEKAACQRGQKLVVIPKAYKEYEKYVVAQNAAMKKVDACAMKNLRNQAEACKTEILAFQKTMTQADEFKKSQPKYEDEMRAEMEALRKSKATLENFTISGHDGGGHFGGSKQSFSKQEVSAVMKDFEDVNKVKSLMLLGCYTGVQREVMDWQITFPDVRLIGGYDGSAPLASRPQGHNYLYDLLTKEKLLTTTADGKKLENIVKNNIRSLNELNAAMFLKPQCENPENETSYYYGKLGETKTFRKFDLAECLEAKKKLLSLKTRLDMYDSGELEPPTNTASGELRQIYNESRAHEHCAELIGDVLDSNKVFGLLFYEGQKKNFADFYDKQMIEAEEIYSGLKLEDIVKSSEEGLKSQEEMMKTSDEDIALLEKDPEAYYAKMQKQYDQGLAEYKESIKDPKYKALLEKFPYLKMEESNGNNLYINSSFNLTEDEQKLYQELSSRTYALQTPKYDLESAKSDPAMYLQQKKQMQEYLKLNIQSQKLAVEKLKVDPSVLSNVWIPTKKNLEGKTRKQTLENQHQINTLLSMPYLPQKERNALSWVNNTVSSRLQMFDNPFSWHEHVGVPEKPSYDYTLAESLKNDYSIGGYVGGSQGGGMYGGGYSGGIAGGMGGGGYIGGAAGGTMDEGERPIH